MRACAAPARIPWPHPLGLEPAQGAHAAQHKPLANQRLVVVRATPEDGQHHAPSKVHRERAAIAQSRHALAVDLRADVLQHARVWCEARNLSRNAQRVARHGVAGSRNPTVICHIGVMHSTFDVVTQMPEH